MSWQAHAKGKGVVTVEAVCLKKNGMVIVSHGRDDFIRLWDFNLPLADIKFDSASNLATIKPPHCFYEIPVNALNFCKFSILKLSNEGDGGTEGARDFKTVDMIVAVPAMMKDDSVDLHYIRFDSPIGSVDLNAASKSKVTIHKFLARSGFSPTGNYGLVMALKLFVSPSEHDLVAGKTQNVVHGKKIGSKDTNCVMMLIGYEIGNVAMWSFEIEGVKYSKVNQDPEVQIEAKDFQCCWTREKIHKETVLCLDINPSLRYGISGSASNNLQYFKLNHSVPATMNEGSEKKQLDTNEVLLKSNGIADAKIRGDDKILATVGWDGNIRIFSRKSLKLLAVLQYHKEGLQCCAFSPSMYDLKDEDEDLRNVLAVGGKDGKISLWKIY